MTLTGRPDRAVRMPDTRQSESTAFASGLVSCGACTPATEDADVPPVLIAVAAVEFRMFGVGVAIGNLREPSGLKRRVAETARHRVVPTHAQSGRGATLEGQLQAAVF